MLKTIKSSTLLSFFSLLFTIALTPVLSLAQSWNTGTSYPISAPQGTNGTTPQVQIAIGDLNGDGFGDVAAVVGGQLQLFAGDGKGNFTALPVQASMPAAVSAVAAGDFTGSGKNDLVVIGQVTSSSPTSLLLLVNQGNGQFGAPVVLSSANLPALDSTCKVAGGVFTRAESSSALDLALSCQSAPASIFIGGNSGSGAFASFTTIAGVEQGRTILNMQAIGANTDGSQNLAVQSILTGTTSSTARVDWLMNQQGVFSPKTAVVSPATLNYFADYDGDTVLDSFNATAGVLTSARGLSAGGFGASQTLYSSTAGCTVASIAAGDLQSNHGSLGLDLVAATVCPAVAPATGYTFALVPMLNSAQTDITFTALPSNGSGLAGYTIDVAPLLSTAVPTGTLAVSVAGGAIETYPLASGSISFSTPVPEVAETILATYGASGQFAASYAQTTLAPAGTAGGSASGSSSASSGSKPHSEFGTQGQVTTPTFTQIVSSSLNPSAYGNPVTFTALVNTGGSAPTGTVTFDNNGVSLGTGGTVSTVNTTNLVLDSNFQNGYWYLWGLGPIGSGVGPLGDNGFVYTGTGSGAGYYWNELAYGFTITPGVTYTFSAYIDATAATSGWPEWNVYNNSTLTATYASIGMSSGYKGRVSTQFTAPAGATSAIIMADTGNVSAPSGAMVIWSEPQIEPSSVMGPYVITGTSSQAGSGGVATFTTSALPAGSDPITAVYGGDSNHTGSTSPAIAQQVNQDSQTITFAQPTTPVTYGVSSSTFSATATSGLTVTFTTTGPCSVSVSTLTITGAGSCVITANQAGNSNYTAATAVAHTITVNQASLTITASSAALSYKSSVPTITPSYATFVNSDTAASLTTAPTCTTAYTATTSVSASPVTTSCSGAVDPNYTISYVSGSVTITKATPTVSVWPTASAITYGQSLASSTLTGGTASAAGTFAWTTSGTKPSAGSSQAESVTFTPTDLTDYNVPSAGSVNVTVNQATLTITASGSALSYGSSVPTITPSYATFVNSDTAASLTTAPTCTTAYTATTSVSASPVTTSCSGAVDPNYSISYVSGSVTITKATPTVSVWPTASAITYGQSLASSTLTGGTASAAGTFEWTTSGTKPSAGSSQAESVTFTPSDLTDYNVPSAGSASVTVNKATLTITASGSALSYGSSVPTITPSYATFVNSDTAASLTTPPTCSTAYTATTSVSASPVTTTCSGAVDANYSISYVPGSVTITKKTPTVSAWPTASAITYGQSLASSTLTGGTASVAGAFAWTASSTKPSAGSSQAESVTFTPTDLTDYNVPTAGSVNVTVNQATLTITASSSALSYGSSAPTITPSYATFVNSDTAASLTTAPTCTTAYTATTSVSASPVTTTCSGAVDPNYSISYVPGSVTISKATATVSVWPTASAITYGQSLASSTLTGGTASTVGTFVFTTPATVSVAGSISESVTFTPSDLTDYNLPTAGSVNVTVNKAALTITASNSAVNYSDSIPSITPSYATFVNGDTAASLTTAPACSTAYTATTSVSASPVTTTCSGVVDPNYSFSYVSGSITISKATPTVSNRFMAASAITYGQSLASSTLTGGTASAAGTFAWTTSGTKPSAGSQAESVTFTPTDLTDYNVPTAVSVNVTVIQATLTITASNSAVNYGASVPTITPNYATFVNGDTATSLTTAPACSTTYTATTSVSASPVTTTCSGAVDLNYSISYMSGSITISKATATVAAWPTASAITYGQTLASSTLSGGTASATGTFAFTTSTTTPGAGTASQSVTFTPSDLMDYNVPTAGSASVTVNKATPTVSAWPTASAITFGQTLANSTLSGGTGSVAGTFAFTTSTTAPGAGTASQSVTFTPSDLTDYNVPSAGSASVLVNKATPTVSAWPTASAITYGQTLASSTLSGGTGSVAGAFAFTTSTTAPSAGTASQSVTFTPSDLTDYNLPTAGSVSVTVNKATPTVSAWPTASALTYGQPLSASTLTSGVASTSGTFAWAAPTTVPAAGTPSESVTFTPTDTTDFTTPAGNSVNVSVGKATLTVTASSPTVSYSTAVPSITPAYLGFVNSDTATNLTTLPSCSTFYTPTSAPGSYVTSCAGAVDSNYLISYVAGSVTVNQATPLVYVWSSPVSQTSPLYGQTSVLSSQVSGTPTGTVTIDSDLVSLGTANLNSVSTTNYVPYSAPYNGSSSAWAVSNYAKGTHTITGAVAPDGTSTALQLASSGTGEGSLVTTLPYPTLGNPSVYQMTFTASVWVQAASGTCSGVVLGFENETVWEHGQSNLPVTTQWQRFSSTYTFTNSTDNGEVDAFVVVNAGCTVNLWGAQFEIAATEGPYIPTSGSATTGTGYVASLSSSNFTAGTHSLTASYSGNTNYTSASAQAVPLTYYVVPLTITASSASLNYGAAIPPITPAYATFVNSDTAASLTTAPTCSTLYTTTSASGTYTTTCSGAVDSNYSISYVAGSITVSKASNVITFTAPATPVSYGAAAVSLTASASSGLGVMFTASPSTTCTVSGTTLTYTGAGTCTITANQAGNTDYSAATAVQKTVTVNQATLMITASSPTVSYGASVPAINPAYSGWIGSDNSSVLTTVPTCSTVYMVTSKVGTSPSTSCSGAAAANYSFNYIAGQVTINQAATTVSTWPTASALTYGQPLSASTLTSGIASTSGTFAWAAPTTVPAAGTPSESVTFTPTDTTDFTTPAGNSVNVSVGKATLTVTASSPTVSYGAAVPLITPAYLGFVNSDTATNLTTAPTCSTTYTATTSVSASPVTTTCSGAVDANYSISYVSGSVTITKATPTVSAWPTASTITYSQSLASSTLTGGTASAAGTFAWTASSTKPSAGSSQAESVTLSARDPSKRVRSSPVEEPKYKKINNNPSKPVHPFPAEARVAKV